MMKRTLSLLLCLVMVLGFAAPAVQASGNDNVYTNDYIMDNIVIEDGANVDIVVDGNTVITSQDTKLPNPVDLVTDAAKPAAPVVPENSVLREDCECVDLASTVDHLGVCLVKAPYMELCENASAEELFAQWTNYNTDEQSFLLSYLQETFPLKHFDLQKLLSAPTGSASETLTDGTTVSVEGIPQDGSLTVGDAADEAKDIVDAYMAENAEASSPLFSYDVSVQDGEGADWQPDISVKMELELPGEKLHKNTKVFVVHVDDNGVASTIEATVTEDGKIAFETPGFSAFYGFTVDFHHEDVVFSIPGMSSIKLSELFRELNVPLNASDVVNLEYTDDTQLKIEQLEGDWLLTSLKAFDTEEKLTMTMADGTVYEIKVTDAEVLAGTHYWHIYNGYYGDFNHIYSPTRFPYDGGNYAASGYSYNAIFNGTFSSAWAHADNEYYTWDDEDDSGPNILRFDNANQKTTVNLLPKTNNETLVMDMVTEFYLRNGANVTIQVDPSYSGVTKEIIIRSANPEKPLFSIVNSSLTIKGSENTKIILDFGANSDGTPKATTYPHIWENGSSSTDTTAARSLNLENVTFRNATVGAIDLYYSQMTNITLKNCSFESSVDSDTHGGAIRHRSNAHLAVTKFEATDCTFDGNSSGYRGGAIALEKDVNTFIITDCKFSNCTAASHGGAISLQGNVANISITGTKTENTSGGYDYTTSFVNCTATTGRGGALSANCDTFGNITIENVLISGNEAGSLGGGLYFGRVDGTVDITAGDVSVSNCDFKDNMAHGVGGGLSLTDGEYQSITVTNCSFENCDTTGYGGAIGLKSTADSGGLRFSVKEDISIIGCSFKNCLGGNLMPNKYQTGTTDVPVTWDHDNDPSTPEIDQLNGASGAGAIVISGNIGGTIEIKGADKDHPTVFENCLTWNSGGAIFFTNDLNVTGTTKTVTDPETGVRKEVADKAVTIQYVNFDKCFARDAGSAIYFSSSVIPKFDMIDCLVQYCGYFDANDENFPADLVEISEEWFTVPKTNPTLVDTWLTYAKEDFYPGTDFSGTFRTVGNTSCVANITNCDFNNNRSYQNGGGVYWNANRIVYKDSTNTTPHVTPSLTISNTDFYGNYASGFGGGIFCEGSVTVESGEFSYNRSESYGGAIAQNVYNNSSRQLGESGDDESTSLILKAAAGSEPVKIHHNAAVHGGGIAITVKATDSYPHTVPDGADDKPANWIFATDFTYAVDFQLGGSHVYENTATHNGGGIFYETAYYLDKTGTPGDGISWAERQRQVDSFVKNIQIDEGLIYSNTAGYGATADNGGGGNGGGIYMNSSQIHTADNIPTGQLTGSSTVSITGGSIYKNTATIGNGGGVYLQGINARCSITGDTTTIGAEYLGVNDDGNAVLSTDGRNTATGKRTGTNMYVGGCGGGIAIFGGARIEMAGGYVYNNKATTAGGGIAVHGGSTMFLTDGYVNNNESSMGGGISLNHAGGTDSDEDVTTQYGMYFNGGNIQNNHIIPNGDGLAYGGGICIAKSTMRLDDGVISDNTAAKTTDGTTFAAGQEGGGIAVCQQAELNIYGGIVKDNKAYHGGGLAIRGASTVNMYPVYQLDSNDEVVTDDHGNPVIVSQGLIDNNEASSMGGGAYGTGSTLYMRGGTLSNNKAYHGGGAYFTENSNVTVDGATVSDNAATDQGGGWYLRQTLAVLNGGTVTGNTAVTGGGLRIEGRPSGLAADLPTVTINGGYIAHNTARSDGGGIWMRNYSSYGIPSMEIYGGEISDNTSAASGGGIFVHGSGDAATSLKMFGGIVSGNKASARGGGINADNYATVELSSLTKNGTTTYPTVTMNEAHRGGGIAVCYGAHLTVKEGFITYNNAVGTMSGNTAYNLAACDYAHGVGGGIWVADGAEDRSSVFTLEDEGQMAIYGNMAEFAGDDVFSNGKKTQLNIPVVKEMNLADYDFQPEGWFEDYNTSDTSYRFGLQMLVNNGTTTDETPILRYRNANAVQRRYMHINPEHQNGKNYVEGAADAAYEYINKFEAYVAMTLGIPAAAADTVVVDFGSTVNINLWQNDLFMEVADFATVDGVIGSAIGWTFPSNTSEKDGVYYTSGLDGAMPVGSYPADYSAIGKTYGSAYNRKNGLLTYVPTKMTFAAEEQFFYTVRHNGYWYYAKVTVVPASTLYFDDSTSFVKYHTQADTDSDTLVGWSKVGEATDVLQAEDRPGLSGLKGLDADNIYGYDGAYNSFSTYSGGGVHHVTVSRHNVTSVDANGNCTDCGQAVRYYHDWDGKNETDACSICFNKKDQHNRNAAVHTCSSIRATDEYCDICSKWIGTHTKNARASFTFTGTGFDIISLCNQKTGLVMVSVYEGTITDFDDPSIYNHIVTSYLVDTYYETGDTLYQVPVIKASGLDYGTYTVEIYIAPSWLPTEHGYSSAEFYLDAIRIYDPAGYNGGSNSTVSGIYKEDGEAWPIYQELRNMFIDPSKLTYETGATGVLFIDGTNEPALDVYQSWGPNNEVYLAANQSIAFTLDANNYSDLVAAVHIGMRGLSGYGKVTVTDDAATAHTFTVNNLSTTDMYYDLTDMIGQTVTVRNSGTEPIALSNIKITHTDDPSEQSGSGETPNVLKMFALTQRNADIALDILTPDQLVDPVLKPKYPALSFEGMVCYNVFFSAEELGDLTSADLGLAVFDTYNPEGTVDNAKDVILGATEIDGLYMVTTNGIHAKYLGDTQYFRAFAKKADGSYIYSKMVSYSALDYAKNVLEKSDDVKLKQLVVAMLNYGAEAQKFFGYKTDDLMNKDLTADEQALVAGFDAGSLNAVGKVDASKVGAFASNGGFTKKYPAISFKGAFEINYFMAPANAVDGEMTLYCWNEDTYNSVTELTTENADQVVVMTLENGLYGASSEEIIAKNLDQTLYVAAVYESNGVTYCSGVLPYSIAAYCQNPPAGVQDLATAAAVYGCTAKQYFSA